MNTEYVRLGAWGQTGTLGAFVLIATVYLIAKFRKYNVMSKSQKCSFWTGSVFSGIGWVWVSLWIAAISGNLKPPNSNPLLYFLIFGFASCIFALGIAMNLSTQK